MSERRWRDLVRADVKLRASRKRWSTEVGEQPFCECCGHRRGTQMHEDVFRSLTVNRIPTERFSTHWCIWVCQDCHSLLQSHRLKFYFKHFDRGANDTMIAVPESYAGELRGWFTAREVWARVTGSVLN